MPLFQDLFEMSGGSPIEYRAAMLSAKQDSVSSCLCANTKCDPVCWSRPRLLVPRAGGADLPFPARLLDAGRKV
jgi:hypothetical protein